MGHDRRDGQYNPRWMPSQRVLAAGLSWFDLLFQGRPNRIAVRVVSGRRRHGHRRSRADLVPGDARGVARAARPVAGVGDASPADAHPPRPCGRDRHDPPAASWDPVVVHERGARHLVDPSKLLDSATRLYGNAMDRLWGEVAPVPERNLLVCTGGETVDRGRTIVRGRLHTGPRLASRLLLRSVERRGVRGRHRGVCVDGGYVLPPTPPPDIDVERWLESLQTIERWGASTLFLTHFGPVTGGAHAPADARRQPAAGRGPGARVAGRGGHRRRAPGTLREHGCGRNCGRT